MNREEIIRAFCILQSVVCKSIPNGSHYAADGFCDRCEDMRGGDWGLSNYQNEGRALGFIRDAVFEKLDEAGWFKDLGGIDLEDWTKLVEPEPLDGESRWEEFEDEDEDEIEVVDLQKLARTVLSQQRDFLGAFHALHRAHPGLSDTLATGLIRDAQLPG